MKNCGGWARLLEGAPPQGARARHLQEHLTVCPLCARYAAALEELRRPTGTLPVHRRERAIRGAIVAASLPSSAPAPALAMALGVVALVGLGLGARTAWRALTPSPKPAQTDLPAPVRRLAVVAARPSPSPVSSTCGTALPAQGPFNYAEALQKTLLFFEAQRLGRLPPGHKIAWRADALLDDGHDAGRDLAGGWQYGGTALKVTAATGYAVAMLSWAALAYADAFRDVCLLGELQAHVRWGAEDLLRAVADEDPAGLQLYAGVGAPDEGARFAPPEVRHMLGPRRSYRVNAAVPGPDVAGHVAAGLAAAALVLERDEPAQAARLLEKAARVFAFGDQHRPAAADPDRNGTTVQDVHGRVTRTIPVREGGPDKLLWAAAWLHRAHLGRNGYDGAYLSRALALHDELGRELDTPLVHWRHHSIHQTNKGAAVMLALMTGGARPWVEVAQNHLDWWTIGYTDRVRRTPDGLAWRQPGKAIPAAAAAAFLAFVYGDGMTAEMCRSTRPTSAVHRDGTCSEVYLSFARQTVDYALGANALGRSYLVGFGQHPVGRPAHIAAMGPWAGRLHLQDPALARWRHVLHGALLGGPDEQGVWDDARPAPARESTIDGVAPFVGALVRLHRERGGVPVATPSDENREDEYFVEAALTPAGDEVTAVLNNRSAWPPTVRTALAFRYYVRLEPGVSLQDVRVQLVASDCGPHAVEGRLSAGPGGLAFVRAQCPGVPIFPGGFDPQGRPHWQKSVRFRFVGAAKWDARNDPSASGLLPGDAPRKALGIPVYDGGTPLYGRAPG